MTTAPTEPCFRSFFLGGFESSSHRRRDGRRLDLLGATGHDVRRRPFAPWMAPDPSMAAE